MADMPQGGFELKVFGVIDKPMAGGKSQRIAEIKAKAAEDGRKAVSPFLDEAIMVIVNLMRTSTDEQMQFKCAMAIMNRGFGNTKALTQAENEKPGANSILDMLAAVSSGLAVSAPAPSLPLPPNIERITLEQPDAAEADFIEYLNRHSDEAPDD